MYPFKKEIDHYPPIVTSEGDITGKDYRILIAYTPENPDRLIKYAILVAKVELSYYYSKRLYHSWVYTVQGLGCLALLEGNNSPAYVFL